MTRMLDTANEVTRPVPAVACSDRGDAPLVKRIEIGVLKALGLYRELVTVEIGRASEHGARWWSRRLVEVYEEAGLVRLEGSPVRCQRT